MSPSKPASGVKAKTKAKAAPAAKRKVAETIRIIPAPAAASPSSLPVTENDKERSAAMKALAADIERAMHGNEGGCVLEPAAVQAMLAALCKVYSGHVEAGELYHAFSETTPVTPTDVMVTASGLLKAANLAVFELGMWQSWTGR